MNTVSPPLLPLHRLWSWIFLCGLCPHNPHTCWGFHHVLKSIALSVCVSQAVPQKTMLMALRQTALILWHFSCDISEFEVNVLKGHSAMWEHAFPTKAESGHSFIDSPANHKNFIFNIYSPTTHSALPWLPGWCPYWNANLIRFVLIYHVLTFWAEVREKREWDHICFFFLPTL